MAGQFEGPGGQCQRTNALSGDVAHHVYHVPPEIAAGLAIIRLEYVAARTRRPQRRDDGAA